jgi:hypothetical protein
MTNATSVAMLRLSHTIAHHCHLAAHILWWKLCLAYQDAAHDTNRKWAHQVEVAVSTLTGS